MIRAPSTALPEAHFQQAPILGSPPGGPGRDACMLSPSLGGAIQLSQTNLTVWQSCVANPRPAVGLSFTVVSL